MHSRHARNLYDSKKKWNCITLILDIDILLMNYISWIRSVLTFWKKKKTVYNILCSRKCRTISFFYQTNHVFLYRNHNLGTNLEPKDSTLTLVLLRCTVWSICFYSRVLCTLYMGRAPRPPAALEEIVYGKKKKERKHLLHSVKLSRMMNVIKRNKTKVPK